MDRHTGKGGSGRRNTAVTCTPIGVIRSPYTGQKAAPRQGRLSDALSEIIVFDEYAPALRGIERRSHLIVLYWLDQADRSLLIAVPPGQDEEFGVFSIRSPSRPNPIGFAVVDLIRRDGTRLTVRGLDAFDGTPVLDIKTYSAEFDCIPEAKSNKEKRAG
ncbi:MAG: tRNA (N6-threonylcarbamoyladenosine(37)-N6)-methyltransferase TrmO [Methanomicrobiaceae archaeon]|nr:tRNA (N6-threonylcarbamoyladenosine(37)-N6)-methyltransferase TrmO [Methanomicrobiaceae archaeon]MDD5419379.1 tRNA (N6-threonylcarbamoyladenosine(37)-N6)-methyltransferase TrmO [Methanomicrobiaceae archaeon]